MDAFKDLFSSPRVAAYFCFMAIISFAANLVQNEMINKASEKYWLLKRDIRESNPVLVEGGVFYCRSYR